MPEKTILERLEALEAKKDTKDIDMKINALKDQIKDIKKILENKIGVYIPEYQE